MKSKNLKGGYKLISLLGANLVLAAEAVILKGIYESIEASYNKPLLITGIVIDDVEKNDVWVNKLEIEDSNFVFEIYGYKVTITADDEVTIEEVQPAGGGTKLYKHQITFENLDLKVTVVTPDSTSYEGGALPANKIVSILYGADVSSSSVCYGCAISDDGVIRGVGGDSSTFEIDLGINDVDSDTVTEL